MIKQILYLYFSFWILLVSLHLNAQSSKPLPSNDDVALQMAITMNQIKPTLPQVVDEITTLLDVGLLKRGIHYFYKLSLGVNEIDIKTTQKMAQLATSDYCTSPELQWWRDNFVEMRWTYYDKNNEYVMTVSATANDC